MLMLPVSVPCTNMQIEALKTFCDIVRLRSFSRGAKENDVTQSAQALASTAQTTASSVSCSS